MSARGLLLAALLLGAALRADAAWPWQGCFEAAGRLHDVPLELLLAVAATESNWDADARSSADAHGVMQIRWPGTARHLGVTRVAELYNPCVNIELGARYLRELLDRFDGDETRALAAYNYGPTRIAREAVLPAGALGYVNRVLGHRRRILDDARGSSLAVTAAVRSRLIVFDHRTRAERFAAALDGQIESGRFEVLDLGDGRHGVRLRPGPDGLSLADTTRLDALGWTGAAR